MNNFVKWPFLFLITIAVTIPYCLNNQSLFSQEADTYYLSLRRVHASTRLDFLLEDIFQKANVESLLSSFGVSSLSEISPDEIEGVLQGILKEPLLELVRHVAYIKGVEELGNIEADVDHTIGVVHHDQPTRAHDGTRMAESLVVNRCVG